MAVDWNDLVSAFDFTGEGSDDTVFIHRKTGEVFSTGEYTGEESPEDIDDATVYAVVP